MATIEQRPGATTLGELSSKVEEVELQARYLEARIRVFEARQKLAKLYQSKRTPEDK